MAQGKKNLFFIILIAVILLIFFQSSGWLSLGREKLSNFLIPWQKTLYRAGAGFGGLLNYAKVASENVRFKEELAKLSVDYIKLAALEAENQYLRGELDFLKTSRYQYDLVTVIGHLPLNDQVLIIDKGQESGLTEGLAVTFNQGVMIGKIIEVEANRSLVQLLADPKSEVAATLVGLSGTNGLLKGQAGQGMLLDLIPQDKEVKEGDLVITSGLEEKIPRGLLIGKVSAVESRIGQIFKQTRVEPPFDWHSFQILTVIKSF